MSGFAGSVRKGLLIRCLLVVRQFRSLQRDDVQELRTLFEKWFPVRYDEVVGLRVRVFVAMLCFDR